MFLYPNILIKDASIVATTVSRPKLEFAPSEVHTVAVVGGRVKVYLSSMEQPAYAVEAYEIENIVPLDVAIEFDGTWQIDSESGNGYFVTYGSPWVYIADTSGILHAFYNQEEKWTRSLGASKLSTVRGWKGIDNDSAIDQGIIIGYICEGVACYIQQRSVENTPGKFYIEEQEEVPEQMGPYIGITLMRTTDYRIGFCMYSTNKTYFMTTTRYYAGATVKPECIELNGTVTVDIEMTEIVVNKYELMAECAILNGGVDTDIWNASLYPAWVYTAHNNGGYEVVVEFTDAIYEYTTDVTQIRIEDASGFAWPIKSMEISDRFAILTMYNLNNAVGMLNAVYVGTTFKNRDGVAFKQSSRSFMPANLVPFEVFPPEIVSVGRININTYTATFSKPLEAWATAPAALRDNNVLAHGVGYTSVMVVVMEEETEVRTYRTGLRDLLYGTAYNISGSAVMPQSINYAFNNPITIDTVNIKIIGAVRYCLQASIDGETWANCFADIVTATPAAINTSLVKFGPITANYFRLTVKQHTGATIQILALETSYTSSSQAFYLRCNEVIPNVPSKEFIYRGNYIVLSGDRQTVKVCFSQFNTTDEADAGGLFFGFDNTRALLYGENIAFVDSFEVMVPALPESKCPRQQYDEGMIIDEASTVINTVYIERDRYDLFRDACAVFEGALTLEISTEKVAEANIIEG